MRNNTRKRPDETGTPERRESPTNHTPLTPDTGLTSKPPPTKKRKLDDSPPWKSVTTQTPTSFIENGRRKSGRTNTVPIELLTPPKNGKVTRQTRSSAPLALPKPTQGSDTRTKTNQSLANRQQNGKKTNANLSTLVNNSRKSSNSAKPSPSKPTTSTKPILQKTPVQQGPARNNPQRKNASKTTPKKNAAHSTPSSSQRISSRRTRRGNAAENFSNSEIQEPHSPWKSDDEMEVGPDWRPPVIRIRFRRTPPLTIVHPLHVPPKPKFRNFESFLESESAPQTEEEIQAIEEGAQKEAEIRKRVEDACQGGVLAPEKCSALMPAEQSYPPRQFSHHDHLIAHALHFQKLMDRERKLHMAVARRLAVACAQKAQEAIPKTQEELEEEEALENQRLYKEVVITGLRNKWAMVAEEIERRRRKRAEELHRIAGKNALNQMIEHSTLLLKVRTARRTSIASLSDVGGDGDAEDDDEESSEEEGIDSEESEEDEVNMSSSDVEDEQDGDDDDGDDDANLSLEELRSKYATLTRSKIMEEIIDRPSEETSPFVDTIKPSHTPNDQTAEGSDSEEMSVKNTDLEEEALASAYLSVAEIEEVDDILLDDEDTESVIMDSELDLSGSEYTDEGPGLLGLLGNAKEVAPKKELTTEEIQNGLEGDEVDADYRQSDSNDGSEVQKPYMSELTSVNDSVDAFHDHHTVEEAFGRVPAESSTQSSTTNGQTDLDIDTTPSSSPTQISAENAASALSQASVAKTPIPVLLRGQLREYQHLGLDWLANLYEAKNNGILADEMGLGKTIQTIALIAHLASVKEIWGPHLIVVPTSVMLNWEMEFKKWAPGFKILTYYGSKEQRAEKRKGWHDDNLWHVCITSYQLVLQDQVTFKRRNWHYLILDEAHNIKNFRSQRWQTLLNFKAEARLLITGTPLQNNLIELWSLLYFLMPSGVSSSMPAGFASLQEFQDWFARPVDQLIEGGREMMDDDSRNSVTKLHQVLRPFLLRRLKADVEKQMPAKYEHVVYCRLSKRQRYLYDEFMSLAKTRETLASGNYLSIINCLMQLRKVCNHPDLFETRQIVTSFAMSKSAIVDYEIKELLVRRRMLQDPIMDNLDLDLLNLVPAHDDQTSTLISGRLSALNSCQRLQQLLDLESSQVDPSISPNYSNVQDYLTYKANLAKLARVEHLKRCIYLNNYRCSKRAIYPRDLLARCQEGISMIPIRTKVLRREHASRVFLDSSEIIGRMVHTLEERSEQLAPIVDKFGCVTPNAVCTDMARITLTPLGIEIVHKAQVSCPSDPFHQARNRLSIAFPDKRLLQYDCGKLQRLDLLLRDLQTGGHRALIFTQMTKVLDILEQFLNIHGHRYLRLDGSTKVEQRQVLTERFNNDPRILVFILSTRSGGLGINLTGADTVIFYDLDWNPAMDKQCQDRCHRIGQTRDVHIYRFVSEFTIESNILRKANQKRMLDDVVIQEGDFTTDYFNKLTLQDMLGDDVVRELHEGAGDKIAIVEEGQDIEKALELAEDIEDAAAAKAAQKEVVETDVADFDERVTPKDTAVNTPKETPGILSTTSLSTPKEIQMNLDEPADVVGDPEEEIESGHVDDWMLMHMEWELGDIPLPLPEKSTSKNKKRSKKAKPYA